MSDIVFFIALGAVVLCFTFFAPYKIKPYAVFALVAVLICIVNAIGEYLQGDG